MGLTHQTSEATWYMCNFNALITVEDFKYAELWKRRQIMSRNLQALDVPYLIGLINWLKISICGAARKKH